MAKFDYYDTLGVTRSATDADIKKAYRKLVFEHHPDRNPNNKGAEAKIRELNAAYEIIGTPFNYHGENAQELERMVALGMTAMEAVRSATSDAATLLGIQDSVGTMNTPCCPTAQKG